jgi:L-fuconolactonase
MRRLLPVAFKPLMVATQRASMMHNIIDPHVHFFDICKGDYTWLTPKNPPYWPDKHLINKNIMPHHLQLNEHCHLQGAVHIEAGFNNNKPKKEVDWLAADVYPQAPDKQFRTIGYIDINSHPESFEKQLLSMLISKTLAGIRVIFDDDGGFLIGSLKIKENLTLLLKSQLIFEFQASFTNTFVINELLKVLVLLPELKAVINHAGLPPLADSKDFGRWHDNIKLFANLPNCYVKCSGFEMTSRAYSKVHVCAVLTAIADLFGYERMMLASNFPLTLFTCSYSAYWSLMLTCAEVTDLPIRKVSYTNAKDLYRFK